MKLQSLHSHSLFDDGKSTMEEMVQGALAQGLSALGFSGHSPMPTPQGWTVQVEDLPRYRQEALRLKAAYRDQIPLYYGLEFDLVSQIPLDGYEYVIGSVHHIPVDGRWVSVDDAVEVTRHNVQDLFHGDSDAYSAAYYRQLLRVADDPRLDIVGHFDQLTKFNEIAPLVNTDTLAYHKAASEAMDALIAAGKIFEINTGAISRGYRTTPYPALWLLQQLQCRGARITITADAHSADAVACGYRDALARAEFAGFRELWFFNGQTFYPVPLREITL